MRRATLVSILILCFVISAPQSIFSATVESVQEQISRTNSQIEALDREIKQYQDQIAKTSQESNTLAKLIKELTLTRSKLLKEREQIQKKITATGLVINTIVSDITKQEDTIENLNISLGKMISDLNKNDQVSMVERLLSEDNLSDASEEYNNILSINERVREHIASINQAKSVLIETKTKKEGEKKNLDTLKKTLVEKETAVAIAKKEKDTLLNETKNKESTYKKLLADREKLRDTFEKELSDYEAQLKFILNPKLIPKEGSGVLSWPLKNVLVTSGFGPRWGRFHYGTDFRASVGTPVLAMASGEVLGTGDTDLACKGASFGKWVFIKYNNGLSSTYGHLSSISAKVGQKVEAGDVVALSGNTGSSTGPHLHVGVYASGGVKVDTVPSKSCNGKIFTQPIAALSSYLNPVLYLPK